MGGAYVRRDPEMVEVREYCYLCPEHGWQGPFDSMRDCPECVAQYCGFYKMGPDGELVRCAPESKAENKP